MISLISLISLILLIWFKSDAFIVYSKLFKLNKFFYIDAWEEYKNTQDCTVGYHLFLNIKFQNNFFIKLITCPICLCVWLCFPVLFFNILSYPIVCVSSLTIYYGIVKLMS